MDKKKPGPIKQGYFRTTITLPRPLMKRVQALSIARRIPQTQIYRDAVEAYLKGINDVSIG